MCPEVLAPQTSRTQKRLPPEKAASTPHCEQSTTETIADDTGVKENIYITAKDTYKSAFSIGR